VDGIQWDYQALGGSPINDVHGPPSWNKLLGGSVVDSNDNSPKTVVEVHNFAVGGRESDIGVPGWSMICGGIERNKTPAKTMIPLFPLMRRRHQNKKTFYTSP